MKKIEYVLHAFAVLVILSGISQIMGQHVLHCQSQEFGFTVSSNCSYLLAEMLSWMYLPLFFALITGAVFFVPILIFIFRGTEYARIGIKESWRTNKIQNILAFIYVLIGAGIYVQWCYELYLNQIQFNRIPRDTNFLSFLIQKIF